MSAVHGKGTGLALWQYDITRWVNSVAPTETVDMSESSNFQEPGNSKAYTPGMRAITATFSGRFSLDAIGIVPTTYTGVKGVLDSCVDNATNAPFLIAPGTGFSNGGLVTMGTMLANKITTTAVIADVVSVQGDLTGNGAGRAGVNLSPAAAISSTTTGAGVDNGVVPGATATGGFGILIVDARSTLAGTTTAKIQHSTDNATWTDLISFTVVPALTGSAQVIALAPTATVNRYVRGLITESLTTGSALVRLALSRLNQ